MNKQNKITDTGINYVNNAFSLNMIDFDCDLRIRHITESEFNENKDKCLSYVGHEDTALRLGVKFNRGQFKLNDNDTLYVAQVTKRLPLGTSELDFTDFNFKYNEIKILNRI